jgi:hypothetical protein
MCKGQYPGPTIEAEWGDTLRKSTLVAGTISNIQASRFTII